MSSSTAGSRPKAVIYARISRDAQADGLGVERQIEDCQKLAKRLGYEVVDVLQDNDISASTRSKKNRPAYNEMLALARAGQVDAILSYSNSRLTRRVREYLDLIDLVRLHGVAIRTVVSGDHDLNTADGRAVALTLATWDQNEAERTSERVRRAKLQMAERGEYRGGRRPYGYEKGGTVIRESEAKWIRKATTEVLAGRAIRAIVREMNEAGARTSGGKEWTGPELRDVLMRPRNMGYLSHGQVGRKNFEIANRAVWPPIVDEDTWRALFAVLTDSSRRTNGGAAALRWLGSGIYRCGLCGGKLRATAAGRSRNSRTYYRCIDNAHLMVSQKPTDAVVIAKVLEVVRDPRIVAAMSPGKPDMSAEREARLVQERLLAGFERDYAEGLITGAQLRAATERVNAKIAEIDDHLSTTIQRTSSSPVLRANDPGQAFLDAPIDIQRAVLATVLQVEVHPATKIGRIFDPTRIRFNTATE
ncbi:MAG TPA: recombinase family protein [Pseudolysinimonas sp.]|jgi:DNA invertase Pin-like site-specific DNA recombinase|nr:recombinase family protein [Pseudolysinimonas sp.]